jgi:polyadenylate-binding protein
LPILTSHGPLIHWAYNFILFSWFLFFGWQMLGESLYPIVDQLEHDSAAKVTGMLLEMDQTEVLHLLESPEALKAKVAEAMEVLRTVAAQQQINNQADQLGSLSLNDNLVS